MSAATLVEVSQTVPLANGHCTISELRLAFGLTDRVDILRRVRRGAKTIEWQRLATNLPAKIEHNQSRIILSQSLNLKPGDRIVDENNAIYQVKHYQASVQINKLPVAAIDKSNHGDAEPRRRLS